jgi:hypothetical protein
VEPLVAGHAVNLGFPTAGAVATLATTDTFALAAPSLHTKIVKVAWPPGWTADDVEDWARTHSCGVVCCGGVEIRDTVGDGAGAGDVLGLGSGVGLGLTIVELGDGLGLGVGDGVDVSAGDALADAVEVSDGDAEADGLVSAELMLTNAAVSTAVLGGDAHIVPAAWGVIVASAV